MGERLPRTKALGSSSLLVSCVAGGSTAALAKVLPRTSQPQRNGTIC
jgi:hypothetical protein